jgi:hypothetical protein
VTELLRLAAGELRDAVGREVLAERAVDLGRLDEEALLGSRRSPSYCIMPA